MSLNQTTLRIVLYEGPGSEPLDNGQCFSAMASLLEKGFAVTRTTEGILSHYKGASLLVLGKFGSATNPEADNALEETSVRFQDITGRTPEQVFDFVENERVAANAVRHGEWKPWFPVIDYDRCTNCMQCLSFCLFGVYGVDAEKKIQVQNNDNCKTDGAAWLRN